MLFLNVHTFIYSVRHSLHLHAQCERQKRRKISAVIYFHRQIDVRYLKHLRNISPRFSTFFADVTSFIFHFFPYDVFVN
ncbi:hypothetical protein CW304_27445 [Bacillus sp. UFRGS-B20]|nr:hypothetical protein CW304_27445 [Bacillus sp. UFRGS-B20]